MTRCPPSGLYVLTPDAPPAGTIGARVAAAIAGGAVMVQYRAKTTPAARRLEDARAVLAACRAGCVPMIVNDDVALAEAIGADGVHLGRDDGPAGEARRRLGAGALVGVSCYDDPERAARARREGASYVAFGCFFPSGTKPRAPPASPRNLAHARAVVDVPVVAIGGITAENAPTLLAAGADLLAVAGGVFGHPDPRAAAERFTHLFEVRPRAADRSANRFQES